MVGSGVTSSLTLGAPVNLPGATATGNGTLYLGSYDGYVYAVDAEDGAIVWRAATGARALAEYQFIGCICAAATALALLVSIHAIWFLPFYVKRHKALPHALLHALLQDLWRVATDASTVWQSLRPPPFSP